MEEHFGQYLRRERELRNIALQDVSRTTKIPVQSLEKLEAGKYEALPGEVFVRGFIRSYVRCLGLDDEDALLLYDSEREKRRLEMEKREEEAKILASDESADRSEALQTRKRVGLAVFVLVVLIIATITLSLLFRRQYHADGGLSMISGPAESHETFSG